MKRLLLLILIVCCILTGCGGNKVTISEINLENANDNVKSFIENVENDEKGTGTGIYIYNDSKNQRYLYLNQDFLDDERGFGDIDIKTDENSINIYLNDISVGEADTYKLYKLNLKGDYEYLKVFKNGEETHFGGVGV